MKASADTYHITDPSLCTRSMLFHSSRSQNLVDAISLSAAGKAFETADCWLLSIAYRPRLCLLVLKGTCSIDRSPMAYKVKGIFKGLKVFSRIFGKRAFYFLSRLKSSTSTLAMHVRWSSCLFVARLFPPWIVLAAVKEHEMEIGYPTDVKHVTHIGWDSAAGSASPSWVNAQGTRIQCIAAATFSPNV